MRLSLSSITRVWIVLSLVLGCVQGLRAQTYGGGTMGGAYGQSGSGGRQKQQKDSLRHRTGLEDTLTLTYRFMDSTHVYKMDTSVNDIDKFYFLPSSYQSLSNVGNAARPIVFTPNMHAGWDAGFHSFDIYRFNWDSTRFYTTTRPYTEMEYFLGSAQEQNVNIIHTQNINQHWNFALHYRLIGAPGQYKSQKSNHNSYSIYTWYESPRKRYHLYGGFFYNNLKSEENGGFVKDSLIEQETVYDARFNIPTHIGGNTDYQGDIFNTALTTGTHYTDFSIMLRQQYDLGQQDSVVVNDSTTYYLFYARLRMQHTIQINGYMYSFLDNSPDSSTHFYQDAYGFLSTPVTVLFEDKWSQILNDFSLFQYPVARNPSQYLTEGITLENLKGTFSSSIREFYNVYGHGEYRNQTRNKKWFLELNGKLYLEGYNVGNYEAFASISRYLGKNIGFLEAGFQDVNRTPSYIYQKENPSSFNFGSNPSSLSNENNSQLFGYLWQPLLKLKLGVHYYLMDNYTYLKDYTGVSQYVTPFNVLQLSANKEFNLSRRWVWYADLYLQQVTGDPPVHIPFLYTRDRLVYQGKFYRKLNLAIGLEARYISAYKEDNYSPLLGQFFPQLGQADLPYGKAPIVYHNRPKVDAFVHFRIRTFYLVARAENLNTFNISPFGFKASNQSFLGYGDPGLIIHFGITWGFVN
jgi:hypothetical protein